MKRRTPCAFTLVAVTLAHAGCRPPAPPVPAAASVREATRPGDLLKRSHFGDGRSLPWMPLYIEPARGDVAVDAAKGAMCLHVASSGKNPWDVQFRHREMTIQKGHTYTVAFTAWASAAMQMRAKVGMSGAPYRDYYAYDGIDVGPTPIKIEQTFTAEEADDPTAEMAFHLGGEQTATVPITVCFDDLHLVDPKYVAPPPRAEPPAPAVRVNQVGFFANGPKRATWLTAVTSPTPFELVDGAGQVLFRGRTQPMPRDPSSGDAVQALDFSAYRGTGRRLALRVAAPGGPATSDPFDVAERGVMAPLARAALRYFYQNRSGVALAQPFTEGAEWAREAGHPTDAEVPCAADAGCDYTLDVSGGWYDAGDYGKYVVNAGLSVWLMLNMWEMSHAGANAVALPGLGDGALDIPESGNHVSDLLDEARWEIEWMLKMQVPEGKPHAGMAHNKIHDEAWTSLAVMPVLTAAVKRSLRPVSTAATLNLAAAAAQAARVFASIDADFARRCRRAAERAWRAAEAEPARLVPASDRNGGGSYDDDDVSDERYWAAAELYVTTGENRYRAALEASPFHSRLTRKTLGAASTISWRETDALGMISLLLGAKVPADLKESRRRLLVDAAEAYVRDEAAAGFGQPFSGTMYPWGSNAVIVDNGIVLAYAHWLTGERRYLDGAAAALDYVLGRNALGKSYVSGFGARPLEQPHHRFWSHALDPKFPGPPPGALAGGPNTALQDPYARAALTGCVGQRCYVDNIEAPSLNEVAINWNAALAWLATYVEATTPVPSSPR
jgi:endoglucanase